METPEAENKDKCNGRDKDPKDPNARIPGLAQWNVAVRGASERLLDQD
jgi:hypothetical protein